MRFSQDDDDRAAANGVLLGVAIGLAMWTVFLILAWMWVSP